MPRAKKTREQLDEEWAIRKNARNAEKWALWAAAGKLDEVVAPAKASDIADWRRGFDENMAAFREATRIQALLYRVAALDVLTPEIVADRDYVIANLYPKNPSYACSAWNAAISRATGRTPTEVYDEIQARYHRLMEATSDMARPVEPGDIAERMKSSMLAGARSADVR